MLKLYRPHAELLLLLAAYTRARGSLSLSDVINVAGNIHHSNAAHGAVLVNARRGAKNPPSGEHWLDQALTTLYDGLALEQNGRGDADLIDQIVRALQLPYARNILSGESMRRLRTAILLPSEQAGLLNRLRQREMSCAHCGIALHDHESVTVIADPSSNGQTLLCHRCAAPTSVPCASCEQVALLSSKAMHAMSRMQCPTCQEAKKEKKHPVDPSLEPPNLEAITPTPRAFRSFSAGLRGAGAATTQGGQAIFNAARNAAAAEAGENLFSWQDLTAAGPQVAAPVPPTERTP